MSFTKIPHPRPLNKKESLDSLEHWINHLKIYYKRDEAFGKYMKETVRWDSTAPNYGLATADNKENIVALLGLVSSYLPTPWLTKRITKETKSWKDVSDLLYTHYEVKPNQITFIRYKDMKPESDERPWDFYCRMIYHVTNHLAEGEILTQSHNNQITLDWLQRIHSSLPDVVAREYAPELRSGTQLCTLVERISPNIDALLKRSKSNMHKIDVEHGSHVQEGVLEDQDHDESKVQAMWGRGGGNPQSFGNTGFAPRGGSQRGGFPNNRGGYQPNRGGFQRRPNQNRGGYNGFANTSCGHCRVLVQLDKIPGINYNDHTIINCPRVNAGLKAATRLLSQTQPTGGSTTDGNMEVPEEFESYLQEPEQDY